MKIRIERQVFDDQSTIGELFVDGAFECYVLEDKVRENGSPVAGRVQGQDGIGESDAGVAALYPKIEAAIDAGDKVTIEIARAT